MRGLRLLAPYDPLALSALPEIGPNIGMLIAYDVTVLATGGNGSVGSPYTGWETRLMAIPAHARIHFPTGYYTLSTRIDMRVGWHITGDGQTATIITTALAGDAFRMESAINTSTAVNIRLADLQIVCTNVANTGGGFVDVGGTFITIERCYISGFKYNIIFDQSEIARVHSCNLEGATVADIWMVNGADHTPGALVRFTNDIRIIGCQFNNTAGVGYQILDDGGGQHIIRDNNFNAGDVGIRFANAGQMTLEGNSFEGHASQAVQLAATTLAGSFVGATRGFDCRFNNFSEYAGVGSCISIAAAISGEIVCNRYAATNDPLNNVFIAIIGGAAPPVVQLRIHSNYREDSGAFKQNNMMLGGFTAAIAQQIVDQKPSGFIAAGVVAGSRTVTPAHMEFITNGARLYCVNAADYSNGEVVTVTVPGGGGAGTFDATFASDKSANWLFFGL